jgi:hypothetical protein
MRLTYQGGLMATRQVTTGRRATPTEGTRGRLFAPDETKLSLKTTEFWVMVAAVAAILIAAAVSDTLGDVRAWTLVSAVVIGYMLSRGLAKSGSRYLGGEDPVGRDDR